VIPKNLTVSMSLTIGDSSPRQDTKQERNYDAKVNQSSSWRGDQKEGQTALLFQQNDHYVFESTVTAPDHRRFLKEKIPVLTFR
jgi:hypothetical protein